MTDRPLGIIISDAMREVEACRDRLSSTLMTAEEAIKRLRVEQTEAEKVLKGLGKLHRQATASVRERERGVLQRSKANSKRPTDVVMDLLTGSLDMLTKKQIQERTGLDMRAVGVVVGHGLKSGEIIEREGLFGVSQLLARDLTSRKS